MSETDTEDEEPKKKSKLPLILGVVFALVGGGGGFFAVSSGLILGAKEESAAADSHATESHDAGHDEKHGETYSDDHASDDHASGGHDDHGPSTLVGGYLELSPIVVTLPASSRHSMLRFTASLELSPEHAEEVASIKPRIIDVMNTYLRSIDASDLDKPGALSMIRAHLLARMHIIAGPDRVEDVLIMEFILT